MTTEKYWTGTPSSCDICSTGLTDMFVDGKTKIGPWACMCAACHTKHGVGLGTGCGQKYERQGDGRFKKVAG